jgi:hypothetical protein
MYTWYRPPDWNAKVFDLFEEFLQKAEAEHKELIILGDLNCDLYTNTASSSTKKLIELLDVYQLKQLIKKPTRVTAKTRTLIDVIITQMGNTNVTTSGVIHLGISDHSLVYTILVPRPKLGRPSQWPWVRLLSRIKQLIVIGSFALKECCGWEGNAG